ncbi:hypothetical protein JQC91_01105 [Jannaschia sp. Os4]|uniref:NepR family anti-sigma factor n=1 Tax=Jannaschia sp. Os4 TaxID=2807617 RepID=UPI0019398AE2|nr:NepR family anti-sigma factor [Jannaschia sp. Os4]MBM2574890.1 hypothetical protein [Jannaschia sp. Os4]
MSQDQPSNRVDDLIDQNLRRVYDDVLQEDVPDRFAKLLAQLERGSAPEPADAEGSK